MLAILTTHPIQYQVPVWQELARQGAVDFEVWYLSHQGVSNTHDPGFDRMVQWDLDLLSGYRYRFLNTSPDPANIFKFRGSRIVALGALLRECAVSTLWINGWQVEAYWQAAFYAHRVGIPVWLRAESNDLHTASFLKRLPRQFLLHHLFKHVDRFLYIGTANRRLYQSFGVLDSKLTSAPYCIDNVRFSTAAEGLRPQRKTFREKWNIPNSAVCFLFCGKFIPKKRPLDIMNAAIALLHSEPDKRRNLHLLFVGEGVLRPELEEKAQALAQLCGRSAVTFLGFLNQTEIYQAYVAADWLILPSDSGETWGLVVNEALACGTPALVSNHCGCAEDLVKPLNPDMMFPCGDTDALAKLLHAAIANELQRPNNFAINELLDAYSIGANVHNICHELAVHQG